MNAAAPATVVVELEAAARAFNDGRKNEAERLLTALLKSRHDCAEAHLMLGCISQERGQHEDALDSFTLAECFKPDWWPVQFQFGLLELDQGRPGEAIAPLTKALSLGAQDARVHNALGAAYTQTDQLTEAIAHYRAALALDPTLPEAHSNLGYILFRDLEEYEAGAGHIETAMRLAPNDVAVLCNWNMVLQHRGRVDDALALTNVLLQNDPTLTEARVTRALLLLMRGDFAAGWKDYEYRKLLPRNRWPRMPVLPEWDGSDLSDKTIFVYPEQGIGDEIMFASCLPDVIRGAKKCIVECQPKLEEIFRRSFPDAVVVSKEGWQKGDVFMRDPPDFKVAAGTLPLLLRGDAQKFPRHDGYLAADPVRVEHWRRRLAAFPGRIKIGISWRGGAKSTRRATRSVPLEQWAPLFALKDIDFINLQYSDSATEIAEARARFGVTIHDWREAIDDYSETAALTAALDLVVSVQTAIVHLAGALGQRVWALISAVPEWRYGAAGEGMPWYPSARLFRQGAAGDWASAMDAIARELVAELRAGRPAVPIASKTPDMASVGDAVRLIERGRLADAEAIARQLCAADPADVQPRHILGFILSRRGDLAGATGALEEAARLEPENAEVQYSLARSHFATGAFEAAAAAFERAAQAAPGWAPAWVGLADTYAVLDRVDDAEDSYLHAIAAAPELAEARYNFANLLLRLGRIDEAIKSYESALDLKPDFRAAHTNLVYAMNFIDGHPPEKVFEAHLAWAKRHAEALTLGAQPHVFRPPAKRALRIGYVSPNFRVHAATYFFEPVLRHHDRSAFAIYCYADVKKPDARTARLRRYDAVWRDIAGHSDEEVAALIRNDEIDILVDLTGYTESDRLLVFARKPAPVQITWNGYANTTGMSAMDYRITDACCDPPGVTDHLHSERLLRMPQIYMPFEVPDDDVAPGEPPCLTRGHITFGSFNALSKLNARIIGLWSEILASIPSARLLIMTVPEGRTRARLADAFATHGIAADRLLFRGRVTERAFLEAHREADIALDTFPFHGTTTTAHSLWMGVPVVTLAGAVHAARVGVTMLENVGLGENVAANGAEYVSRAIALAGDVKTLTRLRSTLRERMRNAPNMDGVRFAHALEDVYRRVWEAHCATARPC